MIECYSASLCVRSCVVMRCESLTHSVLTARHDSRCYTGDWGVGAGSGTLSVIIGAGRTNGKRANPHFAAITLYNPS